MELVAKLTVAFMIVTCMFLAINGSIRARQEARVFHEDMVLDHERLAHALAQAASALRKTDGPEASQGVHPRGERARRLALDPLGLRPASLARPRRKCAGLGGGPARQRALGTSASTRAS